MQRLGIQPQPVEQQQPEPQPIEAQPAPETPPGINPELAKALTENPALREAVQSEVAQIEAAKQTYVQGLQQNAQAAAASLFAAYPELQGIPGDQIKGAIAAISNQNPQRGAEIVAHIERTNAVVAQWQQAQTEQQQEQARRYQRQWVEFAKIEDAKVEKLLPEVNDPKLQAAAVKTLTDLGVSREDIGRLWNGQASISLRDARAQVLLAKAAKWDAAQAALEANSAIRFQRICRQCSVPESRVFALPNMTKANLSRRLNQSGNVKDAAKLLLARRLNRG